MFRYAIHGLKRFNFTGPMRYGDSCDIAGSGACSRLPSRRLRSAIAYNIRDIIRGDLLTKWASSIPRWGLVRPLDAQKMSLYSQKKTRISSVNYTVDVVSLDIR